MTTEEALKEIDLYEQYIQMYIQVLPFVFDKRQVSPRLPLDEIPTFEQFKVRYPLHYQHQVYQADVMIKYIPGGSIERLDINVEVRGRCFVPKISNEFIVRKYYLAVMFAGKRINLKTV